MMVQQHKRWNLFARELEDILATHKLQLGHLNTHIGIHPEKIQRLRQSLLTPKSFPVLNPQEIELVVEKFDLSDGERVRLRAALLATAIERMLMDRIDRENALLASEQIQTVLRDTLLARLEHESVLDAIRGGDSDSIEDNEGDRTWRRVWRECDEGNLALQWGLGVNSYSESVRCVREAQAHFTEASTELDSLDEDWQSSQSWKTWRNEIDTGLALTRERLEDLGAE